jgi:hypothetical protein
LTEKRFNETMEADTVMMQSQVKECQQLPEPEEAKKGFFARDSRASVALEKL